MYEWAVRGALCVGGRGDSQVSSQSVLAPLVSTDRLAALCKA
jgi:hypothetical protein